MTIRICVIIATVGRPELVGVTVSRFAQQTRPPDRILVVGASPGDVQGLDALSPAVESILGPRGLPAQRNAGLRHVAGSCDMIVFFDDDYVPAPDYLEQAETLLREKPAVVGLTGRLIADGINTHTGYTVEAALSLIDDDPEVGLAGERPVHSLYGCNMVMRAAALEGLQFDENLPLYGWQEDIDFTYQLGQRGTLLSVDQARGVHLGVKGGRTSGKRLGYSQVANPLYLLKKRTTPRSLALKLVTRNLLSNALGSFGSQTHIDRRGRLAGNMLAIADLLQGRMHPQRILELS